MTRFLLALLIVGLPFLAGCQGSQEASDVREPGRAEVVACDDASAQLTARAYALSVPLVGQVDELIQLIEENVPHFVPGGGVIRCMLALGNALAAGGLAQSREFGGGGAQERFHDMPPELAHLPGQVDDSLGSFGSDQFAMGQELLWLARVLPPAAQGDVAPFNAGGTLSRQAIAEVLPMFQTICQTDPGSCQLMQTTFQGAVPGLEQQIYNLARQVGS